MDRSQTRIAPAAPMELWAVGIVSLLWNTFGVLDYTLTKLHNSSWLTSMQVDPAMLAAIDAAPLWSTAGWALGVWGSFAGSLLLLARSRHAAAAFTVSLVGALVSFAWQMSAGLIATPALPLFILAVVLALWWYSRRAAAKGWLR